jgi:hypothetical protein
MYAEVVLLRYNIRYAVGGSSMAKSARSDGDRVEMSRLVHDVASLAGRSSKQELHRFGRRNGWERRAFVARGDGPWGEGGACWLVWGLRRLDWVAETITWCCQQMPDVELRALGTAWHQGRNILWT